MASAPVSARNSKRRAVELEELGEALHGLLASLRRLRGRQARLGGEEVSHAQFELLIELLEHGELSVSELAEAAQVTPATVTGMLDHLVTCGYVEREQSARDRRVVFCRLTPRGRRDVQAFKATKKARWESALEDLSGEQLRAASQVLTRLRSIFEEAA